jgi:hypothetical protein
MTSFLGHSVPNGRGGIAGEHSAGEENALEKTFGKFSVAKRYDWMTLAVKQAARAARIGRRLATPASNHPGWGRGPKLSG